MALAGLLAVYRTGVGLRAILIGFLCVCLIVGAASFEWLSTQLIELGADLFDKDPTLTGRTYLWYRADQLIAERPLLGRGFYAFWLQGNTDAEGLWRYAGITSRGGFSFHNTGVEILVQLGWLGLVTVLLTVLIGLGLLLRRFIRRPNLALCIWMSILLYELVRTPIEAVGMAPFYFSTILTFAALAAALGSGKTEPAYEPTPDERRRARAPDRSRRLLEPAMSPSRRLLAPTVEPA
jgi:exopolysaccharide production protein ExoQ